MFNILLYSDEVYHLIKLFIYSIHGMTINLLKLVVTDRYFVFYQLYLQIILVTQEIEPRCAEALCRSFPPDPTIDIISIAKKSEKHRLSCSPLSSNPSKDSSHRHYSSSHRANNSFDRRRSAVTLYFIITRLTNLAIMFHTNCIQYRTFKTGVG